MIDKPHSSEQNGLCSKHIYCKTSVSTYAVSTLLSLSSPCFNAVANRPTELNITCMRPMNKQGQGQAVSKQSPSTLHFSGDRSHE